MYIAQRRDCESVNESSTKEALYERCRRLEAENSRLRETIRMVAALGGQEDLVDALIAAATPAQLGH